MSFKFWPIHKNILYHPYKGISPWRKMAQGTWKDACQGSILCPLEIDAAPILNKMRHFQDKGLKLTPTMVITYALAKALRDNPQICGVLRLGRIYQRKEINLFVQVAPKGPGDDLTGVTLRRCDQLSLEELAKNFAELTDPVKEGDDRDHKTMKKVFQFVPGFLVGTLLKLISFILYDLNLWSPFFGTPRDSFGAAMVTSVGMMGIQTGLAPLVPFSRCPLLLALGQIEQRPWVKNGEVVSHPIMTIGITVDHRLIDAKGGAMVLKSLKSYLQDL